MTAALRPSLEDLRLVSAPSWLWDAERRRIVWANDAGLRAFGCVSLFELVNRTFDPRDTAIERLAGLAADLSWGPQKKVLLHLPSTGQVAPIPCLVYVHVLADGRTGLLTVADPDAAERKVAAGNSAAAQSRASPAQPSLATKAEAFATLSRTLSDNLRGNPPKETATGEGAINAQARKEPVASGTEPPGLVRHMFERNPSGIIVCRSGAPLYATARAAAILGHGSVAKVMEDGVMLSELHSVPTGMSLVVDLQRVGIAPFLVSRQPLPWRNGQAEQFTLKPLTKARDTGTPAEPSGVTTATWASDRGGPEPAMETATAAAAPESPPSPNDARDDAALDEMKAILDVASDGIITLGRDGEILAFSAAAEAIFGMSTGQAAGRPLASLLHPDSRRPFQDYLTGLKGAGLAAVFNDGREMIAVNPQGGEVPLFITMGKLQSRRARAAFCAVVRDLTSWKRTERELIEARDRALASSRQKSDFLARISHELRTPLNAVLGFSEVMRTQRFGALGNEKYLAYANDIHSSGRHLLSIIGDLLDLSKIEAGKLELDFMAVNVEEVADYALSLLRDEAGESGVILRKSLPKNLPRVVGDQKTLRQIMINLVSNGIKYSDAGDEVYVSAVLGGDGSLTIRVKDTGIGMSDAELAEVLEPYGRIESASRQRPGTGLGLPLTKSLVEANRARFSISSATGKGTLVEIAFPGPRVLAE